MVRNQSTEKRKAPIPGGRDASAWLGLVAGGASLRLRGLFASPSGLTVRGLIRQGCSNRRGPRLAKLNVKVRRSALPECAVRRFRRARELYGPPERSRYGASIMSRIHVVLGGGRAAGRDWAPANWGVCRGSGPGEGVPGGFRFAPGWPWREARRRTSRRGSRRVIDPGGGARSPGPARSSSVLASILKTVPSRERLIAVILRSSSDSATAALTVGRIAREILNGPSPAIAAGRRAGVFDARRDGRAARSSSSRQPSCQGNPRVGRVSSNAGLIVHSRPTGLTSGARSVSPCSRGRLSGP